MTPLPEMSASTCPAVRSISLSVGPDTTQGVTQIGSSFQTQNIRSNGSAAGQLQTLEFTADGSLEAIYNTGARRTLFKVPVPVVTNPNGLQASDAQSFRIFTRIRSDLFLGCQ